MRLAHLLLLIAIGIESPALAIPAPVEAPPAIEEEIPERPPDAETRAEIERTAALGSDDLAEVAPDELAADIVPLTRQELGTLAGQALELARQRTADLVSLRKTNPRLSGNELEPDELSRRIAEYDSGMADRLGLRATAFERLSLILDEWEEKGGDPEKIAEFRAYRRAVITDSVAHLTLGGAWATLKRWATSAEGGIRVLKGLALFVVSVVLLFVIARLIQSAVGRTLSHKSKASRLLQTFIALVVYWVIVLIGLSLIIASLGFDVTPVFAVLGGASFILAFALQETLGNFAAGLMILVYRPFDQGERIIAAGIDGTVRNMNLTSTILATPDNQLVTIPNSKVWNDVILNAVDLDRRRVDLSFVIRHPEQALAIIDDLAPLLSSHPDVLAEPKPELYFGTLDGRGATLQVRPWVESANYWPARRAVTTALMAHFIEQKIELWVPPIEGVITA